MKKKIYLAAVLIGFSALLCKADNEDLNHIYVKRILENTWMDKVDSMAHKIVSTGFNAGDGYGEVWIRDYNTFIELTMDVMSDKAVRDNLNTFFLFQGQTGDVVDGFIDIKKADLNNQGGYKYRLSKDAPRYAAHKNTVETDQETSLIQAVYKYVKKSGNNEYLQTNLAGKSVYEHMELALDYLFTEKFNKQYGLIIGATTADWGDVQPEHIWGVEIDKNTHYSIDIYDNAMLVIALNNFIELTTNTSKKTQWIQKRDELSNNIRKYLWDTTNRKYIPHIYLNGSPFSDQFDENKIYYHGGTAVAIEAGLLNKEEIEYANKRMLENVKKAHAQTIGLTMYPTYPAGAFKGVGMYPYGYQNGGDWTWFGARMIQALVNNGMIAEAYNELIPMLQRVVENEGFNEWYTQSGEPKGSGTFRGEAGVLYKAIQLLRNWAKQSALPLSTIKGSQVFLTFGQSNSANHGSGNYTPNNKVYNYYKGEIYPSRDPLIGATGEGGSVWNRMADKWISKGKVSSVTIVPIGVGGVRIGAWAKDGELYGKLLSTLDQLKEKNIHLDYILWHQGETDNILGTSKGDYIRMFETIREAIRSRGFNAPIVVAIASYHPNCIDKDFGNSSTIREAQMELVKKYSDIYIGPDTDQLNQLYQRADGVHFSHRGQDEHANLWIKALLKIKK